MPMVPSTARPASTASGRRSNSATPTTAPPAEAEQQPARRSEEQRHQAAAEGRGRGRETNQRDEEGLPDLQVGHGQAKAIETMDREIRTVSPAPCGDMR